MTAAYEGVSVAIGAHTWLEDDAKVDSIVQVMRQHGVKQIDTARIYGDGASERAIGLRHLGKEFSIDTKANTAIFPGTGKLIEKFLHESLEALKLPKVRVYLLHGPDETVPFEEQAKVLHQLYEKGYFEKLGLSNFTKAQILEFYNVAKTNGYVLPTVYQGMYNIVGRGTEDDLFPALREMGFSIQAFSPMAMGLLSKTPEYIRQGKGRWDESKVDGRLLRGVYYKDSYFKMLDAFGKLSEESGVSRVGLAYRWVKYHSFLDGNLGDELIIGGTEVEHVDYGLAELKKGPLEPWIVGRLEEIWEMVKADAVASPLDSVRKAFQASSN
ncbi:hypothetical protein S40288_03070 [Stachybotrys chartarum IBT 40288]|nr:hypothetical protein S40288_03070 [Stachybotrys chartarum IBT 40288]